ncbi:phosphonate ABC transporter, permease protein PhnE [Terrilactibacillus sp. BCM23-1]|uniref:Phosphonate ABC transporter, permease protein PhnE n=1 Tax=Terrilactibacillus tamarindi TaxID=2599694 RepID=A0A6N8CLQ0_9BACI|nr:phosphonate ABC transporter, permease protein PhnE [Terrilactibacillus tamarindi]MTT30889.1 phosphonate ABC transporter, permease protein PhnE [Terrilactibacillus tamarindi]
MNETIRKKQTIRRIKIWTSVVIVALIYIWAFSGMPKMEFKPSAVQAIKAIFSGLIHPDWDYFYDPEGEDLLRTLLETLCIAILGTFISSILCVPFAFWAARNMNKYRFISSSGKFVLSVIRVFPELILALLFIAAVGTGPFAGILALGFHSIGMLGKLFGESIEDMDFSSSEALKSCGANKIQTLWFAIVPQVMPSFVSFTLYRFELSVRAATILGIVGAGGIGAPLIFALQGHKWDRVGMILIGIIVMVTIIDYISSTIRKRIV